jgi:hypothetical protein
LNQQLTVAERIHELNERNIQILSDDVKEYATAVELDRRQLQYVDERLRFMQQIQEEIDTDTDSRKEILLQSVLPAITPSAPQA